MKHDESTIPQPIRLASERQVWPEAKPQMGMGKLGAGSMKALNASKGLGLSIASLGFFSMLGAPVGALAQTPSSSPAPQSPWTFTASIAVKESFDSNVFIQDYGDLAKRESWVTSLLPAASIAYQHSPAFKVSLSYAPELAVYHSEDSEDYVAHRGAINFSGKVKDTAWEVLNGIVWTDGNHLGPTFTPPGDIPAVGGIPLRDRRDAAVYRNSFRITQTLGKAFLRPVFNSYVHDFKTELRTTRGYENYIDRYDLGGGLDAGYEAFKKAWLVLGYRFGHQEQSKNQFNATSPYSNDYHRFLFGIEGTPTTWLKLNLLAGPDVRDWSSGTPPGFDRNELLYFIDVSVSLMPSKKDTFTIAARRYEQPAFSSHSVYEDIVYDFSYRHTFSGKWTAGAGFKIYGGDWQAPVNREDWIFTPSATLIYRHDQHLSAELSYAYDWADSKVPNTQGREYTRHIASLGLKYAF